jgi:hypothetical protein
MHNDILSLTGLTTTSDRTTHVWTAMWYHRPGGILKHHSASQCSVCAHVNDAVVIDHGSWDSDLPHFATSVSDRNANIWLALVSRHDKPHFLFFSWHCMISIKKYRIYKYRTSRCVWKFVTMRWEMSQNLKKIRHFVQFDVVSTLSISVPIREVP